MFAVTAPLHLRLANAEDQEFFKRLYATTRDELKQLGLTAAQFAELMHSQQQIQEHGVRMTYPDAQQWTLILTDHLQQSSQKIGRLIIDYTNNDWRIVDIAILPEYRNQGWGTQVMQAVMAQAQQTLGTVSLGVMRFNQQAQALYARLGFTVIKQDAVHAQMLWHSVSLTEA